MIIKGDNIQYWAQRAQEKDGWETTTNDPIMRRLELEQIDRFLKQYSTKSSVIIDLGCGDGFIEQNIGDVDFKEWHAIDPTELLINKARPCNGVTYHVGDVSLLPTLTPPDIVFTIRTLINVPDQKKCYLDILEFSKRDTIFFFCEPSIQGLAKINSARDFFKLPQIVSPHFNQYIDENELREFFDVVSIDHFASAYFFGSRIVNALINPDKQNYNDTLNLIFKDMKPFGEWGVQRVYICRKRS